MKWSYDKANKRGANGYQRKQERLTEAEREAWTFAGVSAETLALAEEVATNYRPIKDVEAWARRLAADVANADD